MIELKDGLVLCEAVFMKEGSTNVEELGLPKESQETEACAFRFVLSSLESYNPGTDEWTTLRLKSGTSFKINVPFEEFDKFIIKNFKYV